MIQLTQNLGIALCLFGLLAWITLIVTFGLMALTRRIIALVTSWM
jgi:hypothetical protein